MATGNQLSSYIHYTFEELVDKIISLEEQMEDLEQEKEDFKKLYNDVAAELYHIE